MRFCRVTVTWLLVLGVLALLGPAGALASSCPSAGDQQYVDPLSGCGSHSTTTPSSTSSSSSSQSTAPASQTSTVPSGPSGTTSPGTTTATTVASASTTTTTSKDPKGSSSKTLPRTGFDAWLGAGLGLVLLGAGLSVRRRAFRA